MNGYVIDTHALVWHLTQSPSLSARAKEIIKQIERGEACGYISAIVIGESVAVLLKQGQEKVDELFEYLMDYEDSYLYMDVVTEHCRELSTRE